MTAGADTRLPTGTVTFMFTDIEDSTGLLSRLGDSVFSELLSLHHEVLRESIASEGGVEVATEGDAFFAVFVDPLSALASAATIQQRLLEVSRETPEPIRVRIGIHTGNGVLGGDDYVGVDVNRASRISNAAHGGQVVLSELTGRLVGERLPGGAALRPLGRYRLSGFAEPMSIQQLVLEGLDQDFPPLRARRAESSLPKALSDFVGREDEITDALEILESHRLLTLLGPGGTGKTRLALEIAFRAEPRFGDGACFVSLAPLMDADLIPVTILEALGLDLAGGVDPKAHVLRYLSERQMLMVMDNFEHLPEGAPLVSELLAAAGELSVIATSRAPLRVSGERELPVPPLETPPAEAGLGVVESSEAVQLFLNRARAVRPGFALTSENVEAVTGIVRALDGLPLALELAASRLRSLTPESVYQRLGIQLLSASTADLPERQQTIVAAIGWSYELLDDQHRRLFEQLSVFSGSFGLDEAELVCTDAGDVLEGLTELVEQSLVIQTEAQGAPRFRMLTVIREFAYGGLVARGGDRETQDRHARVYTELAEKAEAEILTSRQGMWLERLTEEHDNLRAAFDHAVATGDTDIALRLVAAQWRFWQMKGHLEEGRSKIETALSMPGDRDPRRARALTALGGMVYWQGEWQDTRVPYEEALAIFRETGSPAEIADALYNLSFALGYYDRVEEGRKVLEEAHALNEELGSQLGIGKIYWAKANLAVYAKEWDDAIEYLRKSVDTLSRLDAPFDQGWAWYLMAHIRIQTEAYDQVREPVGKALEIFAAVRDLSALILICEAVAGLAAVEGARPDGSYFAGAAQRIKTDTGVAIGDVQTNEFRVLSEFLASMDDMDRVYFDEGFNSDLDDVIARVRGYIAAG
jgi:predicted ATPase/class 3 adenylate cyclase